MEETLFVFRIVAITGTVLFALMFTLLVVYGNDHDAKTIVGYALTSLVVGGLLGGLFVGVGIFAIYEQWIKPYCARQPLLDSESTELI